MIKQRYEEAAIFHGHRCPGLAIGVRAAWEARLRLGEKLLCVTESINCSVDAFQVLLGCTFGNGKLISRPTGKCAFSFFAADSGESLRLIQRRLPQGLDMEEKIDFILTAPIEQVFVPGPVRRPWPEKKKKEPVLCCAVCGEPTDGDMLGEKDGRPVCTDCADEK